MRNVDELVYMFGSFLPSQRQVLLEQSRADAASFMTGLSSFLSKWARADWLEEYNVERVGEWVAKHCSNTIKNKVSSMANDELASVAATSTSIRFRTYKALLDGMERAKAHA